MFGKLAGIGKTTKLSKNALYWQELFQEELRSYTLLVLKVKEELRPNYQLLLKIFNVNFSFF